MNIIKEKTGILNYRRFGTDVQRGYYYNARRDEKPNTKLVPIRPNWWFPFGRIGSRLRKGSRIGSHSNLR